MSDRPLSERVRNHDDHTWFIIDLLQLETWADEIAALEAENAKMKSQLCDMGVTDELVWRKKIDKLESRIDTLSTEWGRLLEVNSKLEAERDRLRGAIVKWARAERNYKHSFYMPSKVMIFDESDPLSDEPIVGGEELHRAVNELYEMADLGPCDCYVCKRLAALEEGGGNE